MGLDGAARLDTVVFDKTGTLTRGEPAVVEIVAADGIDETDLLESAAAVERESEHPLAEAVVREAERRGLDLPRADSFESVPGHGALAQVAGRRLAIGNARLMEREGIALDALGERMAALSGEGRTVVVTAIDGRVAGLIAIADGVRQSAREAVAELRRLGVAPVMLTGDNRATAERVAAEVGIDEVLAEVLPGQKAERVAELQAGGRRVAMVGDGVNDAPATAIEISRGTVRKMRQNLGWAIGYNSLALPIAVGVFEPWGLTLRPEIAAITMAGSSIIVAVNALALRRLRLPEPTRDHDDPGPRGRWQRPRRQRRADGARRWRGWARLGGDRHRPAVHRLADSLSEVRTRDGYARNRR